MTKVSHPVLALMMLSAVHFSSCDRMSNAGKNPTARPYVVSAGDTVIHDSLLSDKFGIPMYRFGEMVFDSIINTAYISGYLHFGYPDKISRKTGNYVYRFNEGVILNSYVDAEKSERRVEDGDTEKTYVSGVGRQFGVRLYSEYDDEETNLTASITLDTSSRSVLMSVKLDGETVSSIELSGNSILIRHGVPLYSTTGEAANDGNLRSGSMFRVSNGNGTSQLHIKE